MKKLLILLILLLPINIWAEEIIPNAKSGILIEATSGKIIYEKEKDTKVSVASMTKMVAQIIILEEIEKGNIKWSDIVTVSHNASDMGGSQIYLEENEKITVKDLMKGISVASGNDATVAMAEYISGTEDKFVSRMNKKVKELKLKNTHFMNSTGLDEENHYSTAYDMAVIARELVINHPKILEFSSIYEDYLREDTNRKFWLVNTNKILREYEGADGLKTGHTDNAQYCLAATAKRNDIRLIAIVLGENDSKVRNKETKELLDYGFQNIKVKELKKKNEVIKRITINKGDKEELNAILKNNLIVIEDLDKNDNYTYKVNIDNIKLPIKKGKVIGNITVYNNKKEISKESLIADRTINKLSIIDLYKRNILKIIYGDY